MANKYIKQIFEGGFDANAYCDFSSEAASATAGKDIVLAIWDATGASLLAIEGQQSLTINRSADTIEVTSKDTEGGWKSSIAGMKEWSIDNGGVYVKNGNAHKALSDAFEKSNPVCIKVYDQKAGKGLFGGLACITEYNLEAPYDDAMTYSVSLQGMGALVDLTANAPSTDTKPQ